MKYRKRMLGLVTGLLLLGFCLALTNLGISKGTNGEYWYGALIVTTAQGIELLDNPQWFPNCRAVALISFHFDDGYLSVYNQALPIFQEYGLPASAFVITSRVGRAGYMSVQQLQELHAQNGWEIGSHSVTHRPLTELSPEEVQNELSQSKETLEKWGFEVKGFVSPRGKYNQRILEEIKHYYEYHRTSWPGINPLPLLSEGLGSRWELYYVEVHNETPPEEVMGKIMQVNQHGGWIIVDFHNIGEDSWRWTYSKDKLKQIISYVRERLNLCTFEEFRQGNCPAR